MTRYVTPPFQINRPLFVKVGEFQGAGQVWKRGDLFTWERLKIPHDKVLALFSQDFIHHNPELEEVVAKQIKVGDGLEELNLGQLHGLVKDINAKVKSQSSDASKFVSRSCKVSQHKEKQIGLIRSWRIAYGHLE